MEKIRKLIMCSAIILGTLIQILQRTSYLEVSGAQVRCVLLLVLVSEISIIYTGKYSKRELFIITLVMGLLGLNYVRAKEWTILLSGITIIMVRELEIDKILRYIMYTLLSVIVIHMLCSVIQFNQVVDVITIHSERGIRVGLGIGHPNYLGLLILQVISIYMWLHWDEICTKKLILIIGASIITYVLTYSKTFLITIMMLMLMYYIKEKKNVKKYSRIVAMWIFPLAALGMYILCRAFEYRETIGVMNYINMALTGRVNLGAFAISEYGVSLLGNDFNGIVGYDMVSNKWLWALFTFDSLYTQLMVNYGVLLLVVIAVLLYKLAYLNSDYKIHCIIIIFSLYSLTEMHGINVFSFFPLLLLSQIYKVNTDSRVGE